MWEYRTETFTTIIDTKRAIKEKCDYILGKCGDEGWELVNFQCVGALGSIMILVFKRAK